VTHEPPRDVDRRLADRSSLARTPTNTVGFSPQRDPTVKHLLSAPVCSRPLSSALVASSSPAFSCDVDGPAPTSADEHDRTRTIAIETLALTSR
jgi:hypothetical protein